MPPPRRKLRFRLLRLTRRGLGLLFALLGLVTDSVWALAAGTARGVLRRSRRFVSTQRYVTGTVYVGLGVLTALAGSAED